MCHPIYIDPSIQVTRYSGAILPGETPIEAAVRRSRERKSLDETERKRTFSDDAALGDFNTEKEKEATVQEVEEKKAPEVYESEVVESGKRRSSCRERWRDFKHHYLP